MGGSGCMLFFLSRRESWVTIRVLLADDQTLIRSGFRVLVSSAPDLEVVAEASNGREAVELARTERWPG